MAEPVTDPKAEQIWQARCLLRAARSGTLATARDGQPYAALVTPATAPDLSVLLWLSTISEHTRQLALDPRCSLLVCGAAENANPQTAPRVTVTGMAEQIEDATLKARWLAVHPYAALYAGFADFALWRIAPMAANLVGGFARATRLRRADLTPDPAAVRAIADAADDIIAHCNTDHPDAMAAIGQMSGDGADQGPWQMVTVDVDGFDLAAGDITRRIAFAAPVTGPHGVRSELVRLARSAR
jgi:heme iron utilization protein